VVELPGLIFLLREIFPHIQTWRFDDEQNRTKIYTIVLQYIFDILQLSGEQLRSDPARTILRDTCVYSLLNLDNGLTLLRLVIIIF
jgi:nuclear pore complex protein Nup188